MKKSILIIVLSMLLATLVGCGNKENSIEKKRKELEKKYDISIIYGDMEYEGMDQIKVTPAKDEIQIWNALKGIDTYFSKMPEGFIKELYTKGDAHKNALCVVLNESGVSELKYDIKDIEYWFIDISADNLIEFWLEATTVETMYENIVYSSDRNGFLEKINDYNPEGFSYKKNNEEYMDYVFDNKISEDVCFIASDSIGNEIADCVTIYVELMLHHRGVNDHCMECPKLRAKAQYFCDEVDRVFESVDEHAPWNIL